MLILQCKELVSDSPCDQKVEEGKGNKSRHCLLPHVPFYSARQPVARRGAPEEDLFTYGMMIVFIDNQFSRGRKTTKRDKQRINNNNKRLILSERKNSITLGDPRADLDKVERGVRPSVF